MTTKYQHIIPASYIWQFSANIKPKRRESSVYYYDLWKNKVSSRKAEKLLWENWYFEIDYTFFDWVKDLWLSPDQLKNTVEERVSDIENKFIQICQKYDAASDPWWTIEVTDLWIILEYAIHLHMRTRKKRQEIWDIWCNELKKKYHNNPKAIALHKEKLISQWIDPTRMDKYLTEEWKEVVSNALSARAVLWYKTTDVFYRAVKDKFDEYKFTIILFDNAEDLITSDNPLVIWNRCILFPIKKNVCLIGVKEALKLDISRINSAIASSWDNFIVWSSEELIQKYKIEMEIPHFPLLSYLDEKPSFISFLKIWKAILNLQYTFFMAKIKLFFWIPL